MSFDQHLHWRQTGTSTWKLHLAQVRYAPAHFVGSCRLSVFHANVRVLVSGKVRWSIDFATPRDSALHREPTVLAEMWRLPLHVKSYSPVGHPVIEEAFQATLAARALRGDKERLSQNSVQEVCPLCPPTVQRRIDSERRVRRALAVWGAWEQTYSDLRVRMHKDATEAGASTELAWRYVDKEMPP